MQCKKHNMHKTGRDVCRFILPRPFTIAGWSYPRDSVLFLSVCLPLLCFLLCNYQRLPHPINKLRNLCCCGCSINLRAFWDPVWHKLAVFIINSLVDILLILLHIRTGLIACLKVMCNTLACYVPVRCIQEHFIFTTYPSPFPDLHLKIHRRCGWCPDICTDNVGSGTPNPNPNNNNNNTLFNNT